MSKPVSWPPQPRLHKASGQSRVRIGGRDYYLGAHDSPEARQRYADLISELTRTGGQAPAEARQGQAPGLLVCDVIARWTIHARSYYSARGREQEQYRLALRPLERLFGTLPAREFGLNALRQLQQALIDGSWMQSSDRVHPRAPKSGGWCRSVINAAIRRVRTMWRWAEDSGLVQPGAWQALRVLKAVKRNRPGARDTQRARTTTLAEVKAVCRGLTPLARAMLLVQFWTGMRSGEVRIMRAGDVIGTVYSPRQHKTDYLGHSRRVMLGPRALAALRPWLARAAAQGPDTPVFPSPQTGQPWSPNGYAHVIRKAAVRAGLPHFFPYLCRGATRMRVARHGGDEAARAVLGQRSLDVSLRYGEIDHNLAAEAQRRCG